MELPLSLDDFQAFRGRARGKTTTVRSAGGATAFDPRKSGQPTASQAEGMEALQRAFARSLGPALQARLQAPFEILFTSAEQLSPVQFLEARGGEGYCASLGAAEPPVVLALSVKIALGLLDRLLGGSGKESIEARPLTPLENQVLQPIGRLIGSELQAVWQPLHGVKLPLTDRASDAVVKDLQGSSDRLLALRFQARFQEIEGELLIAVPSSISTALLRRLAPAELPAKIETPRNSERLREKLLNGCFSSEVRLPRGSVSLRQLTSLRVGDVVALQVSASQPLEVYVADRHMFLAAPVACGNSRGAQVRTVLPIAPKSEEGENQ